jgi:hypothetical protein
MPYNATTGTFARVDNSFSNPAARTGIVSSDADAFFDDIDLALNKSKTTYLSSQHSVASTTQTEVTGLQQTLVAGTYRFSYFLICQSGTAADGLTFSVNYTGTVTKMVALLSWPDTGVIAALGAVDDVANAATGQLIAYAVTKTKATTVANLSTGTAGVASTGSDLFLKIEGVIVVSDGGDFELWHGSESTNATTVEVGSSLLMTRVN